MGRKIGKLGMKPIKATDFFHGGEPGANGGAEYYGYPLFKRYISTIDRT